MMKTILLTVICSLMGMASAMALETDLSKKALNKLMNKNPRAFSESLPTQRVNTLIAHMMTSSFNQSGEGALSVVENNCVKKVDERGNFCSVIISTSSKKLEKNGSFLQSDDLIQVKLRIDYRLDDYLFFLVGDVTYSYEM